VVAGVAQSTLGSYASVLLGVEAEEREEREEAVEAVVEEYPLDKRGGGVDAVMKC